MSSHWELGELARMDEEREAHDAYLVYLAQKEERRRKPRLERFISWAWRSKKGQRMSDAPTLEEIKERWADTPTNQCEDWWYSAVRHCQRNVDELCVHESDWNEPEEGDNREHPDRYDGTKYAHAPADIAALLAMIEEARG